MAAREGIDPLALTEPLAEEIDPHGLNLVCEAPSVRVSFEYHGYIVTIDSDLQVDLTEIAEH